MRIASIDVGTNHFHLLVVERQGSLRHEVYKADRFVRLGEGGINERTITPQAQERALAALRDFKEKIDELGCQQIRAVATSAVRNAHNRQQFVEAVRQHTGIEVEVIDGNREAELIYAGIRSTIAINETSVIIDIGGGSVEFIICNPTAILWKQSFEIGAQRLFYRFHNIDPIPAENVVALNQYLAKMLQPLLDAAKAHEPKVLIGSSGTFDTLSNVYCHRHGLVLFEHAPEFELPLEGYRDIHKELLIKNRYERADMVGMNTERKDMIVTASCVVNFVLRSLHLHRMRVCAASLREGLAAQA